MKTKISAIIFLALVTALLAAVACGSSSTATVPSQTPPTEAPAHGDPPPEEPAPVAVPAPIEDSNVVQPAVPGGGYTLKITSGLPNGCAEFNGYTVERDFNRFVVEVTNLTPHPSLIVACTEIYGYHEGEVVLGSGLVDGGAYSVEINGEITHLFTVQYPEDKAWVEKESPVEEIEVTKTSIGYFLTVVSRLPKGSSCSRLNGFDINRRSIDLIEITVTHTEVPGDYLGPCTADLPTVTTEIPLGTSFEEGQTYTVSVNGTETTFPESAGAQTGVGDSNEDRPSDSKNAVEHATIEVRAPVEESTLKPPETASGPYVLKITSGLPSGCAQFAYYHLRVQGNDYSFEVMNRIPAGEMVACTAIYGYHEGQTTLGDGALNPGETYTVTINGELAHTFIAQ